MGVIRTHEAVQVGDVVCHDTQHTATLYRVVRVTPGFIRAVLPHQTDEHEPVLFTRRLSNVGLPCYRKSGDIYGMLRSSR